jgi:hypothetical protein
MLLTTNNPVSTKGYSHNILKDDKYFVVEYICLRTGKTKIEKYLVPLTKKEIEAEYDYVVFD